jgi:hypothetical protein
MLTQKQRVLKYLQDGNVLTRLDGWDKLGVTESPARVSELRQDGHNITTLMVPVLNRYGERVRVAQWRLCR